MIVFAEVSEPWQEDFLEERLSETDQAIEYYREPASEVPESSKEEATVLSVFIQSELDEEELASWPRLEFISTRSTGYDHVDLDYCGEHEVAVSNVPTYGDNTVAEHTFALILSLSRRMHEVTQRTQRGDFQLGGLRGFDLRGKTLGVVGTGHIGIHVIKMARGFGMDVLAHDVDPDDFMAELLDFEYAGMDRLLEESHIITLHVPLNNSTKHMIDREALKRCRDEALIINTARGGLINTDALLEALEEDRLAGAGLDVLEGEEMILSESKLNEKEFSREKLRQLVQNNELLRRDDVVFTPHMAYNSREAFERILSTTVENITGYLAGTPHHLVTDHSY
jgi:D-lactate dehydrogenase